MLESRTTYHVRDATGSELPFVRELFREYAAAIDIDLGFQGFERELQALPGAYAGPDGCLLLAVVGDDTKKAVGCGALRRLDADRAEIKRLYVRPEARGRGLARQITRSLIERASQLGYSSVALDSLRRLSAALRLYQSMGFVECKPFNANPHADVVYLHRRIERP